MPISKLNAFKQMNWCMLWWCLPLCMLTAALWWGIPSNSKLQYLFTTNRERDQTLAKLAQDTSRILSTKKTLLIPEVTHDCPELSCSEKLKSIRRYLLYSENPDEMLTLAALAAMNPSEGKFDPKSYTYGSIYFYCVGVSLKIANILGINTLKPSAHFYLKQPTAMGRLYVTARAFNLAMLVLLMIAVYRFVAQLGKQTHAAIWIAVAIGCCPAVLVWGAVLKPHLTSSALGTMSFYYGLRFAGPQRKKSNFFVSICFAAIAGSFQYTAVLTALFPLCALWTIHRYRDLTFFYRIKLTLAAIVISMAIFLCLNPYHLPNWQTVLQDTAHTKSMHPFTMIDLRLIPVGMFLMLIAAGPGFWLALIILLWKWRLFTLNKPDAKKFSKVCFTIGKSIIGKWCCPAFVIIFLLGAASVTIDGFLAVNARFFLLIVPSLATLCLVNIKTRAKTTAVIIIIFIATGFYITTQHIMASLENRPHFQASKWISQNIAPGESLYVRQKCAPFRYPLLNFHKYRVCFAQEQIPSRGWLISSNVQPLLGKPIMIWQSPLRYFRISFAEQHIFLYKLH